MQDLNRTHTRPTAGPPRHVAALMLAVAILTLLPLAAALAADASCPWTVRPEQETGAPLKFGLAYDGTNPTIRHFYAFSAPTEFVEEEGDSDAKLARIVADGHALAAIDPNVTRPIYRIVERDPPDSVVYLVASSEPINVLETLQASIEPERAIQVSRAPLTRGGSDRHGPLPPRSDEQAVAEATPETEFCWFVVASSEG